MIVNNIIRIIKIVSRQQPVSSAPFCVVAMNSIHYHKFKACNLNDAKLINDTFARVKSTN